jgi:hypothetical protein
MPVDAGNLLLIGTAKGNGFDCGRLLCCGVFAYSLFSSGAETNARRLTLCVFTRELRCLSRQSDFWPLI